MTLTDRFFVFLGGRGVAEKWSRPLLDVALRRAWRRLESGRRRDLIEGIVFAAPAEPAVVAPSPPPQVTIVQPQPAVVTPVVAPPVDPHPELTDALQKLFVRLRAYADLRLRSGLPVSFDQCRPAVAGELFRLLLPYYLRGANGVTPALESVEGVAVGNPDLLEAWYDPIVGVLGKLRSWVAGLSEKILDRAEEKAKGPPPPSSDPTGQTLPPEDPHDPHAALDEFLDPAKALALAADLAYGAGMAGLRGKAETDSPATRVEWLVEDEKACDHCKAFAALGPVPAGTPFGKDVFGHDCYHPPHHPRCRCRLRVVPPGTALESLAPVREAGESGPGFTGVVTDKIGRKEYYEQGKHVAGPHQDAPSFPAPPALGPRDAVIVVDVQNDFLPGGPLAVAGGHEIVPEVNAWLGAARKGGATVVATRDWHAPDHASFAPQGGPWPVHAVRGTPGADFHKDLALPADALVVGKDEYSAFAGTDLHDRLRERGVRRVWVTGLAQDYCVRETALDAARAGYEVHVVRGATRPVTPEGGARAVEELRRAGVVVESVEPIEVQEAEKAPAHGPAPHGPGGRPPHVPGEQSEPGEQPGFTGVKMDSLGRKEYYEDGKHVTGPAADAAGLKHEVAKTVVQPRPQAAPSGWGGLDEEAPAPAHHDDPKARHAAEWSRQTQIEGTRPHIFLTTGHPEVYHDPIATGTGEEVNRRWQQNQPLPLPSRDPEVQKRVGPAWAVVSRLWPEAAGLLKHARLATAEDKGLTHATAGIDLRNGDLVVPAGTHAVPPEVLWHELVHLEQLHRGEINKAPMRDARGLTPHGFRLESEAHQRGNMQARDLLNRLPGDAKPVAEGLETADGGIVNPHPVDLVQAIEKAAKQTDLNPTEAQQKSGNYKKGRVLVHGLWVAIEHPRGSVRKGVDQDGKPWSCRMAAHYGYFPRENRSEADGDHVDCFIGPEPGRETVFVIDQLRPDGAFDEHKCILGARDAEHAEAIYRTSYSPDWRGLGALTEMRLPEFKEWLKNGDTGRPVSATIVEGAADPDPTRDSADLDLLEAKVATTGFTGDLVDRRGARRSYVNGKEVRRPKPVAPAVPAKAPPPTAGRPSPLQVQAHGIVGGKLTKTDRRALAVAPKGQKEKLGKQLAGAVGEAVLIQYLKNQGHADAGYLSTYLGDQRNNLSADLLHDHELIEAKTGMTSNGPKARQWRLTIGEPGVKEKAVLAALTPEQRAKRNAGKQAKIRVRKQAMVQEVSKRVGRPCKIHTMTVVLDHDNRTADVYRFEGLHDRIGWDSPEARAAYVGSFRYGR